MPFNMPHPFIKPRFDKEKPDTVLLRIYRQFSQDEAIAYIKQQMEEQKASYEARIARLDTKLGEDTSYIAELEHEITSLKAVLSEKKGRKLWSLEEVVKDLHERIAAQQRANTDLRRKLRKETDFAMSVVFKYNKISETPIDYNPETSI